MTTIPSWGAVAVSGLLVIVAVAIAAWQQLGISRDIVIAAVRALVQLVAVGAVLAWLFAHAGVAGALLWVAVMAVIAANESRRRGAGLPARTSPRSSASASAPSRRWASSSSAA